MRGKVSISISGETQGTRPDTADEFEYNESQFLNSVFKLIAFIRIIEVCLSMTTRIMSNVCPTEYILAEEQEIPKQCNLRAAGE